MPEALQTNRRPTTTNSPFNALSFLVESIIKGTVSTAIPVRVDSCTSPGTEGSAGYVSATPLVTQRDAAGNTLPPVSLPQLPFFRLQCGTAAVVMDPQPGDIGLAVFAQQDCSGVASGASTAVPPGSFRAFDMADGFYVGGFLGQAPQTWVQVDPLSGGVSIKARNITLDTPLITVTGRIEQTGTQGAGAAFAGDVTSDSISLQTHTHSGVETGSGNTSAPNGS